MTPHAIFVGVLIVVWILARDLLRWMAVETKLTTVFDTWYPLLATICVLYEVSIEKMNNNNNNNTKMTKKKKQPSQSPRETWQLGGVIPADVVVPPTILRDSLLFSPPQSSSHRRRRRRSSLFEMCNSGGVSSSTSENNNNKNTAQKIHTLDDSLNIPNRMNYWLQYWMVVASVAALKQLFHTIPFAARIGKRQPGLVAYWCIFELVGWIWVNTMPSMTPSSLQVHQPYSTPVEFLAQRIIQPVASILYQAISQRLISAAAWNTYVVDTIRTWIKLIVWVKLITEQTQKIMEHWVVVSREIILPAMAIFSWPLAPYGIWYVTFVLPVAKSAASVGCMTDSKGDRSKPQQHSKYNKKNNQVQWLQYWVIHAGVTFVVGNMAGLLWWIPFSNLLIFVVLAKLALGSSESIQFYYDHYIQAELQAFCILPPGDSAQVIAIQESKLARLVFWIIDKLPSAAEKDDDDNGNDPRENHNTMPDDNSAVPSNRNEMDKHSEIMRNEADAEDIIDDESNHRDRDNLDDDDDVYPEKENDVIAPKNLSSHKSRYANATTSTTAKRRRRKTVQ
jgi:FtsH-binding integral membrane protein